MKTIKEKEIKEIFDLLAAVMLENKDWLIELDGAMGDGDLGLTMSAGFAKISETLKTFEEKDIGKIFIKAGMAMAQAVPSTMGTLTASGLMAGGKAIGGKEEFTLTEYYQMLNGFAEGIMARGKAKLGDKTIIDSLYPAVLSLKASDEERKTLEEGSRLACEAAEHGFEKTREMLSRHGRAAYYQEKSIGRQDPGAAVGMLFVKTFADYLGAAV